LLAEFQLPGMVTIVTDVVAREIGGY